MAVNLPKRRREKSSPDQAPRDVSATGPATSVSRHHGHWRPDEDQFLRDHYLTLPLTTIAASLGRTLRGCQHRAIRLGAQLKRRRVTEQEKRVVLQFFDSASIPQIAVLLGRPVVTVQALARRLGLRRLPEYEKYTAEEDAYLLAHFPVGNVADIARTLGRTAQSIRARARYLNIARQKKRKA